MRIIVAGLLSAFISISGAQTKDSDASIDETLDWVSNFSNQHAYLISNGTVMQTVRISRIEGCVIQLDRQFPDAKTAKQIKRESDE
jgi:hypothetical protein